MDKANSPRLAEVIGAKVREQRQRQGSTQEQLAVRLGWRQSHVAALEAGDRAQLTLDDLVVLCAETGLTLADMLAGSGPVTLARKGQDAGAAQLFGVRRVLGIDAPPADGSAEAEMTMARQPPESEVRVARKLGVSGEAFDAASWHLWRHSFTYERERRVAERAPTSATPRSLQAIRGHVTRQMLDELGSHLAEDGRGQR